MQVEAFAIPQQDWFDSKCDLLPFRSEFIYTEISTWIMIVTDYFETEIIEQKDVEMILERSRWNHGIRSWPILAREIPRCNQGRAKL